MVVLFVKWLQKAKVSVFWVTQQCNDWSCCLTASKQMELVCSLCACMGSFQGLQHLPTVQRLACEVNWDLCAGHWCEYKCECSQRE